MAAADGGAQFSAETRHWPENGRAAIPNWVYTDPEIFAREQERIFSGPSWLFTCLEAEIPNPGDFKRSRLGTREVVAVRNATGEINVLVNRCAHRSMQFCSANRGSAKEFVCPYHQWTYDLDGKLLGLPFRRGYRGQGGMPADFRTEDHGLQRLATTHRNGVVFASFGAPNESLETYLGDRMLGYFDRVFDGRDLVVLGYMRQRIPSNWKLMFENIKDPYHASLLHVFLVTFGLFRMDQQSAVEMDDTGRHGVLVNRRAEQQANEATAQMRAFHQDLKLADPRLLDPVRRAFTANPALANLLVDPAIARDMQDAAPGWRRVAAACATGGIPVPALAASLAYFDSYRTARLPQNLTQAQRDAFGAHTFERIEKPGFQHFEWGIKGE